MKIVYVVLDGAADSPSSPRRALEEAYKPNIDLLSRSSVCGMLYTLAPGVAPQSDVATLSLLGYRPEEYYPGRGPLEAMGAGLELGEGAIALRANFATVDPSSRRILDRRVGRSLTSSEARALASALDGLRLDGGRGLARFRATLGHRGVLVLEHREHRLSGDISNTDPAYERRGNISVALSSFQPFIRRSKPLKGDVGAAVAARLVNEFSDKAIEILDSHPVNLARESRGLPKANAVLLRDAGGLRGKPPSFRELFGLKAASVTEMVVERGIARFIGIRDASVDPEGVGRQQLLEYEAKTVSGLLSEDFDLVYVHLKGPDEPGHDGDFEGKVRAIEDIDKHFFSKLLESVGEDVAFIVTSDHATPWDLGAHSGDPVPIMISHKDIGEGVKGFSEASCGKGRLGVITGGYKVIPLALSYLRGLVR